jgi:hypothetical protein
MVTMTTLIGIYGALVKLAARLGVGAERAPKMPMTPKNRATAAGLLRMSHGSEVGRVVPRVSFGPVCTTPAERRP